MAAPAPPPVLLSADRIAARVAELATQISGDYAGVDDLLLVGVLRGAFIFLADLSRRLTVPRSVDFVALSRYEHGSTPTGEVRLIMDLRVPITGRHVLLVEDIVDSGGTLDYLTRTLRARNPASLRICTLTRKPDRAPPGLRIDYVGFDIPDQWVVGYGLDYCNQLRTLPYIGVLATTASGAEGRDTALRPSVAPTGR
ncbi:MAG TPA: hypoxanthine phosphoribosyltransferase [Gemmatimonadales bacterium]|nr:hypoxanthine phosphoribosyltransferase [Gemmatimonadales bacterium]